MSRPPASWSIISIEPPLDALECVSFFVPFPPRSQGPQAIRMVKPPSMVIVSPVM